MFQTPSYRTARTIGTGQSNPGDVHRLRRALKRTGHGRFPGQGAPNVTPGLMEAIKRFQTDYGLEADAVVGKAVQGRAMRRSPLRGSAGMDVMMGSGGQDSFAASTRTASTRSGANPVTPEIAQRRSRVASPARPTGVVKPSGSDQRFLDRVEHDMRDRYVEDWRKSDKPQAAHNLERYLDGSGKPLVFSRDEARSFEPIRKAEERIRQHFETRTLVARSGKTDNNETLKSLKDGETAEIKDDWHGDYKGVDALQDAVGGTSEEKDFYRAFGRTKARGKARIRATRKGDTLYFDGIVTQEWDDTYDFHPPEPGSGEALALEEAGRAKPFRFGATWKQRMRGTARIRNGKITDPEIQWTDIDE